jgi:hypothetical protein
MAFSVIAVLILRLAKLMELPAIHCVILAVIMHVAGVYGDLFESQWKRACNVKDSGKIIPVGFLIVIVSIILLLVFGPTNILSLIFGQSTTGTIYAFGYTLLMGTVSNFIMGVWLSRVMLKSVINIKGLRKKWLFGGVGE